MGLLGKLFLTLGKWVEESDCTPSDYEPKYGGKWVNRGTVCKERWEWVETNKFTPVIINVHKIADDFILMVSTRESGKAIDTMRCDTQRQLDSSLEVFKKYYSRYGQVYITREEDE